MPRPLALLALFLASPALADGPPATCQTQADMPEMIDCATWHLGEAERELGRALTDLRARFPQTAARLDAAQAAWSAYRDATCFYAVYPSDYGRGTEMVLDELSCKTRETLRRAADLDAMFTD